MRRHGDTALLALLGIPSGLIGWQIAATWGLPAWIPLLSATLVGGSIVLSLTAPRFKELSAATAIAILYGLPVMGAIVRWHLVPMKTALIGDGAYQIQIARNLLLRGIDPYGFNYTGTGLENTPWSQPFTNPALHHLDYWPGTIVLPLPLQAAAQAIFGLWDERILLLLAGVAVYLLLRRLVPGPVGRMAALAFFLIPGHSLLAVLGDNDLPMIALVLAAALAIGNRQFLLAAVLIGLAIATKQTSLIVVPPLVAWAVGRGLDWRSFRWAVGLGALTVLVLLTPFVLWNPSAFIRDTLLYNIGSGADTYPIQGMGLSTWLLDRGIIHGARDAFPFLLIQLPLVAAAWIVAGYRLVRRPAVGELLLWCGVAFFVFLWTNRFAQPSYILLGTELIIVGLLARLYDARNVSLVLVRPPRVGGRLSTGPRHLGGDGASPASGDIDRRDSVAD